MSEKPRVVSGIRPTGRLHLGHLHGVLKSWASLQEKYECFFFIADWHGLTTEYENPEILKEVRSDIVADILASGIDTERSTIFVQSDVKEHAELYLLLAMLTPKSWLERVPSYKELQQTLKNRDLSTYGFLGYPLLQTADIALYQARYVPVGADQVPHIELAREVIRRFNYLFGGKSEKILTEPEPILAKSPKLLGPDRQKMSKSYENCIYLADSPDAIRKKVLSAITDPARVKKDDPGHPEICLIFDYHKIHSDRETTEKIGTGCRNATIGCVEDKKMMAEILIKDLSCHQKRRESYLKDPSKIDKILEDGARKARVVAAGTMKRVREVMKVR